RAGAEAALAPVVDGAVGVRGGRIAWVGPRAELPAGARGPNTEVVDAGGGLVGPGFVDAHTHLVFAGERSREFELRARGASYLEIAAAGGGIANTMTATRAASHDELMTLARPRVQRLLEQGVTCAEVKSGYGLSLQDELKMLEVASRLSAEGPLSLVPTLLCAHAVPPEFKEDRAGYVRLCEEEILPAVAKRGLARFFDVFCERSAFTAEETRRLARAAKAHGLEIRLHVDQLTAGGGAELAAELGAVSADHLEQISPEGIAALARAGTVAVLVPTATFFLKLRKYAPGRALWDAGVPVALGTNLNPGSAFSENLAFTLSLAVLECGLTPAEAYWAATRGAALSMLEQDRGHLVPGAHADLVVLSCKAVGHLPYHLGISHARVVARSGQVVFSAGSSQTPCD
ncbi:MAG: imidazolonepropionase, partial [Deltaproteobacteria bacterium]|nr:imidazolonepropionase [Deltaproteobacteria bacterium]